MLERREITRQNVDALLDLKVHPKQENLVAPNSVTLAQARYEPASSVWGLWQGDAPIGLIAMIDLGNYPDLQPGDDPNSAYLWRLMIGAEHQGKGFGRFAIGQCKEIAQGWNRPLVCASVVDAPNSGMGFYEKIGFRQTGRIIEGELEIVTKV